MIAVVAAFTLAIRVPTPVSGGYINLSDVAIFFTAFTFGPLPALVAGCVGAGLADVISGAPEFSWLSLIAHGLEGLVAGYLFLRMRGSVGMIISSVAGGLLMVLGYFLGETAVLTGIGPALAEMPLNVFQAFVGGLLGIALTLAVRRAYPSITKSGSGRQWRQM